MSYELRVDLKVSGQSINISSVQTITNNGLRRNVIDSTEFAASAANKQLVAPLDISTASLVYIKPSVNVQLKTNSTSEPDDTKTLEANKGFLWFTGCGFDLADYFAGGDITAMYFTNQDTENAGSVEVIILDDSTV